MADFFLSWNPNFTGGDQTIQYKLPESLTWTDYAVVSNEIDSYLLTGLSLDTIYSFRIINDCGEISLTTDQINMICPVLTVTKGTAEILYSFDHGGSDDIRQYNVKLYKDGVFVTEQIFQTPFVNPLTGSFPGLDENGIYRLKLVMFSDIDSEKECAYSDVQVPLCVSIVDLQGTVNESGTVTITVIKLSFNQQAHTNQIVHLAYREASDPDEPGSYTSLPDATVGPNGNIISPSPYTITVPETSIVVKAYNDCDDADTFSKQFDICEQVTFSADISGQCISGYVLSPDKTYCYKDDIKDADCTGGEDTNQACHFDDGVYHEFGTVFYKQSGYNANGTWTITPTILKTANAGGSYAGTIWGNPSSNTTDGRLNKTGIWLCGDQSYSAQPLGFSRTINISTSGIYYIGFGADNYATLKINGVTIVAQDEAAIDTQLGIPSAGTFKYWHVYPVYLNAGVNYLSMIGTNSASIGIFGVEVYLATEAELLAVTTDLDLQDYIIFSTKDIVDNTGFDVGNCNCDAYPGYTVIYDTLSATYKCKKVLTSTPF